MLTAETDAPISHLGKLVSVSDAMSNMTKLLEENSVLDKKIDNLNKLVDDLHKEKSENIGKITNLVYTVKGIIMVVNPDDTDNDVEVEAGNFKEKVSKVYLLKEEEKAILIDVHDSDSNLKDHEKLLLDMQKKDGRDNNWQEQLESVKKFRSLNRKYKEFKEKRLKAIRQELSRIDHGVGSRGKKKSVKERFVTVEEEVYQSEESTSQSQTRIATKRKLDESVLDCGSIVKKISSKEMSAMVPRVLKVEEDSPPNPHVCNFCQRSFTSAAPLVVHLERHYSGNRDNFDCPNQACNFSGNQETLTKHMRSKHTLEQLFMCSLCPTKFHTIVAKNNHEKRHSQSGWGHCGQVGCRRFYQLARGNCSRCKKK